MLISTYCLFVPTISCDNGSQISPTVLQMGLFDFLDKREGDFVPLKTSDDTPYGPGPLILMYAVPNSIHDEELFDMIEDGMPNRKGVILHRVNGVKLDDEIERHEDELLNMSVEDALNLVVKEGNRPLPSETELDASVSVTNQQYTQDDPCPVLYFSGVTNKEMMDTYNIIANEIYEETSGVHWPACAKVVKPAMQKSLRQVLMEISGDHADAMKLRRDAFDESK